MENEQINVQSGKKTAKSWANYVSIALAALGLLFLLLLLVKYKDIEGNKHFYYIWDLFSAEKFQFMPLVGIILLVASIPLYVFGKRNTALPTAAFILQILAAVAFFLTPNMYVQSMGGKSCTMEVGLALAFACSMASAFFGIVYAYSTMPITVREMAEDGILVAAAVALNFLKIPAPEALTGGSINLQFLPLFILALRHGPLHGFIASGIAFGLITCLTDGYGFQYYPFDYLIGFGSAAVLGFFKPLILGKNQKTYNVDGEYFCDTCEDVDRGLRQDMAQSVIRAIKRKGVTAIPTGRYRVTMDVQSPKFAQIDYYKRYCKGYMPRLLNVPGFDGILIQYYSQAPLHQNPQSPINKIIITHSLNFILVKLIQI